MSKKKNTPIKNWRPTVVRSLGFIYLSEFLLRVISYLTPTQFPSNIYSFLMDIRIISPLTALNNISEFFWGIIFLIFLQNKYYINGQWLVPNGPDIYITTMGISAILLEIIFIIGLFKKWRFSWIILCFTAILALLKNYGIIGALGGVDGGGYTFNPQYGLISIVTILAIGGLYILIKTRSYYK